MPSIIIKWSKRYCEDLGEIDEDGLYDYAYRYFVYSFYSYNNDKIIARIYAKSLSECALYITLNNSECVDDKLIENYGFIVAVITFMQVTQGVNQFKYLGFSEGYKSINLNSIKNNLKGFSFEETNKVK